MPLFGPISISENGDRAGQRVDALGLVAVGLAPPLRRALVMLRPHEPLALDLHGQLERSVKDRGNVAGAMLDRRP
jgi:hypothetical protein